MLPKTLVVGFGSIGSRHARVLAELGCSPAVVSRRDVDWPLRYATLPEALAHEQPEYVVIADRTSEHQATLELLATSGYDKQVLVEKPLFASLRPLPSHAFADAFVAYNFRFHPALARLQMLIQNERVLSAQVYVGQYLPDWRPGTDYRRSYSSRVSQGGGVLRDLSHELDYVRWLFGEWTRLAALGGRLSDLEIETDDLYGILLQTERCPVVTVQMNYLDRVGRRQVVVNTAAQTFTVDLISGAVRVDDLPAEDCAVARDFTYRAQHQAVLFGPKGPLATLDDGLEVLRMIQAAEQAVADGAWIHRSDIVRTI